MVDADSTPPDRHGSGARESLARVAVFALVLAFPLAYLPRLFRHETPHFAASRPRNAHLVVVTTSIWPASDVRREAVFEDLALRAARIDQTYSPSASAAGAAASLWTGRYPANHAVRSNAQALAPGTWTLARALRDSGSATGAFLEEPFVSATGIDGFDEVLEVGDATAEDLATHAAAFLGAHAKDRVCLWVHVARAGPDGARLARIVGVIRDSLAGDPRRHLTMLVVAGFARPTAEGDGTARAPMYVQLPSGLSAGFEGAGAVSLVDLAGAVCDVLGVAGPAAGAPPLQSHVENLWKNVNGGGGFEWTFLEGTNGDVLRFGKTRVAPRPDGELAAYVAAVPEADGPFVPASGPEAEAMVEQYRVLQRELERDRTAARTAVVEDAFRDWLAR